MSQVPLRVILVVSEDGRSSWANRLNEAVGCRFPDRYVVAFREEFFGAVEWFKQHAHQTALVVLLSSCGSQQMFEKGYAFAENKNWEGFILMVYPKGKVVEVDPANFEDQTLNWTDEYNSASFAQEAVEFLARHDLPRQRV